MPRCALSLWPLSGGSKVAGQAATVGLHPAKTSAPASQSSLFACRACSIGRCPPHALHFGPQPAANVSRHQDGWWPTEAERHTRRASLAQGRHHAPEAGHHPHAFLAARRSQGVSAFEAGQHICAPEAGRHNMQPLGPRPAPASRPCSCAFGHFVSDPEEGDSHASFCADPRAISTTRIAVRAWRF